jgi:hypothetical protein
LSFLKFVVLTIGHDQRVDSARLGAVRASLAGVQNTT